jgi:hypothetical protein
MTKAKFPFTGNVPKETHPKPQTGKEGDAHNWPLPPTRKGHKPEAPKAKIPTDGWGGRKPFG